jgi:hypothetical protein
MKKKIGEIYNKPIVTGDKNLVTKNEIHESSLGGNNSGGDGGVKEYYYKILNPIEGIIACLINPIEVILPINQETNARATGVVGVSDTGTFSYYPLYYYLMDSPCIAFKILDKEDYIWVGAQNVILPKGNLHTRLSGMGQDLTQLDSLIQEITKEEYESLITQ